MSLFTQHAIDSESEADTYQTSLAFLSKHPLQMLLLRIGDMIQLMQILEKDPLQFLNQNVLHSLTPATAITFVKGETAKNSLISQLFHSICSSNDANNTRSLEYLETVMQNEISDACDELLTIASCGKNVISTAIDHNKSIASCVKTCYDTATFEMSNIELAFAERSLKKLNELAEKMSTNGKERRCEKDSRNQRSTQNETPTIKALEEQLAIEADRLFRHKSAHQLLCSCLELEQNFPIGELSEDIRKSITSSLELFSISSSGSHSNFLLLDGSGDLTVEIDGEMIKTVGFSAKEGGPTIEFLQAIFLGRMDIASDEAFYPAPIRDCVKSSLTHHDIFVDSSCLLSRIDSLLKAVKRLEKEFLCSVDLAQNESVELSFSTQQSGEVIKVVFVFESLLSDTWSVTTVPSIVKVSIISTENDRSQLSNLLEIKSNDMLKFASHSDPTLLQRIVNVTLMGRPRFSD